MGELHLKKNHAYKFEVVSKDVTHNFNIPEFVVLMDAVPGRTNIVWFSPTESGEFDIQCREYCGLIHYNMRAKLFCGGCLMMLHLISVQKSYQNMGDKKWF